MADYGIVRLDKVRAVYNGHIESVVHTDILENGMAVKADKFKKGERELREVVIPKAGDGGIHIVAVPEINKSEYVKTDAALENFYTPANKPARAYRLETGDVFSITKVDGVPAEGKFIAADGLTFKVVDTMPADGFAGEIVDIETLGTPTMVGQAGVIARINKYVVILVHRN
ncbi:hypothetical protein M5X17_27415 [Paenibacillus alvei]|uniref:hypothetical protein n=1 Tax=Paenibacillus alvei TaxID=44250 RepID=UPI002280AD2E|nr:hypothetical protein [Paenibacillus alvei]MCY9737434.1 hypothetical protein [Paenibacillus alvei]